MLARRDIRGNEQLLWDYPWRPSEEEEEEEERVVFGFNNNNLKN